MNNENLAEILKSFDDEQSRYADFAGAANRLISNLLAAQAIMVHSVTYRCKTRRSLEKKVSRPDKNYTSLADVTDVAAVRITTYFAEDVDVIARFIGEEFAIDLNKSIDKRVFDQPDRFGYLSLHFVASFNSARLQLSEYRRFNEMRFEIQIRSILQHAWAEIEHDLGYKSANGVPASVSRRFARVASLLELADSEFQSIRQSLISYEKEVPQAIIEAPDTVELDTTSIRALLQSESKTRQLDLRITKATCSELTASNGDYFLGSDVRRLNYFGIHTVAKLEAIAHKESAVVENFAQYWLGGATDMKFPPGIGLFYLSYVVAWRTGDEEMVRRYLEFAHIGNSTDHLDLVRKILAFKVAI